LSQLALEAGDLERAGILSKRLGERGDGAIVPMQCLQAQILMHQEAWGEARHLLERIPLDKLRTATNWTRQLAAQAPLLLAVCHEQLSNPDQQLLACQRAVDAAPTWPAAQRALAISLAGLGKSDLAAEHYRKAVNKSPPLRGEFVQFLIGRNSR